MVPRRPTRLSVGCQLVGRYVALMVLDDGGAQIDPPTLPENIALMQEIDAQIAAAARHRTRQQDLAARLAAAVPEAVTMIEARVLERDAPHAREEDLRGGIARHLRSCGELVLTEAKLTVPGWTDSLGGFDLAVVVDDSLVVAETKWADGNLYESMWDILKLGSALAIARVDAAVAIYGAPAKHWQRPDSCARLFEDREIFTHRLIRHFPREWAINLAGSAAQPLEVPSQLKLTLISQASTEVRGKAWEVRAVSVSSEYQSLELTNGWPEGVEPAASQPLSW